MYTAAIIPLSIPGRGNGEHSSVEQNNKHKMNSVKRLLLQYARFLTRAKGDIESACSVYKKVILVGKENNATYVHVFVLRNIEILAR